MKDEKNKFHPSENPAYPAACDPAYLVFVTLCVLCVSVVKKYWGIMKNIIVTGNGTGVGKTIFSAILTAALKADYWKPIQECNETGSDSATIQKLSSECYVHPSTYNLKAPLSPHHAARLESIYIDPTYIQLPKTSNTLVIETAGGLLVPLNSQTLNFDIFNKWKAAWVVVSRHYLGSINHTLLTLDYLTKQNIQVAGIVFNGTPNPDTEQAILHFSKKPKLFHIYPEKEINSEIIKKYAFELQKVFYELI